MIVTQISVELSGINRFEYVIAKQGDANSRLLQVQLLNNGKVYVVDSWTMARVSITKPDGEEVLQDCVVNNNKVEILLDANILAAAGTAETEIVLTRLDGYILTSASFDIVIVATNTGKNAESSSDYKSFKNALAKIDGFKNEVAQAATKQELAVERERINQITKLQEGSTTGDAELMDGRTDYQGKTWDNIGGHIRGVAKKIAGDIDNQGAAILGMNFKDYDNMNAWYVGELNVTGAGGEMGAEADNAARVRSCFMLLPKGTWLYFNHDLTVFAGMYIFVYDINRNFLYSSYENGGYLKEYTTKEDCYVRVVTKYNDGREITDLTVFNDSVKIYYPKNVTKTVKSVNEWFNGELFISEYPGGEMGAEVDNAARARSQFIFLSKGEVLTFNHDLTEFAGMYVFVYDAARNYLYNSGGYVTEYAMKEDCYVRVVTKYNDEREITDLTVFNDLVKVYYTQDVTKTIQSMNEWFNGEIYTANNVSGNAGENAANTARVRSRFIFLSKGDALKLNHDLTEFAGMYVFEYDTERKFVSNSTGYETEYIAKKDCYVRVVTKYNDGREITDLTAFNDLVMIERGGEVPETNTDYHITGDFSTYYVSNEHEAMTGTLPGTKIKYIYDRYDALMNSNPDYITKNLLGYATAADGTQDTTLPIYEYVINADGTEGRKINPVPTILIQSGIHGNEKSSVYGTLLFFEELFNSENDIVMNIRSNFNFKVLPILNPYGYNANVRTNARGVDINRNFSYKWEENDSTIKGENIYSEKEAQILRDWLKANKTALMYIDYHNMGDYNPYISYINTPNEIIQNVYSNMIRRFTAKWRKRYHNNRTGSVYGWINNDMIPCTFNEAIYEAGIALSCTLEIAWDEEEVMYTKRVIETSVEQLVNFIAGMIDYLKKA